MLMRVQYLVAGLIFLLYFCFVCLVLLVVLMVLLCIYVCVCAWCVFVSDVYIVCVYLKQINSILLLYWEYAIVLSQTF